MAKNISGTQRFWLHLHVILLRSQDYSVTRCHCQYGRLTIKGWSIPGWMCVERHFGCPMSEVAMRPRVRPWDVLRWTEWWIVTCISGCKKLLFLVFIFESYFGLTHGWRSFTRLPLPLFRFQQNGIELQFCGVLDHLSWHGQPQVATLRIANCHVAILNSDIPTVSGWACLSPDLQEFHG